jgi:RimJ/RimL family protein N-acetyltransferase
MMEEIVHLIPLLILALLFDTSIILFILVPPFLFGATFALIEWGSQAFSPYAFVETVQLGIYTGTTALISQFTPLFLTAVSVVLIRRYYHPASWRLGVLGALFEGAYGIVHWQWTEASTQDIIGLVAVVTGISTYAIDRFQQKRGTVSSPPQQLYLASGTPGDLSRVTIRSDRLDLRSIQPKYAEDIYRTFTPEVTRFLQVRAPMIPAESEQFIRETLDRMAHGYEIVLSIHPLHSEEFLGLCGIHARSHADTPHISVWLSEEAQGHGYGKEIIDALLEWGSHRLVCERFACEVAEHNRPGIAIVEANGGERIGETTYTNTEGQRHTLIRYALPRRHPDPAIERAHLQIWIEGDALTHLHSERYRLEYDGDVRLASADGAHLRLYSIHGRHLFIRNGRIQHHSSAWVEAGERLRACIDDPHLTTRYLNLDAVTALALSDLHNRTESILSIERISALTLDPLDPNIRKLHRPSPIVRTVTSVPGNYYILVFAVNGRYKYIYHYRSDGQKVFDTIHTMGDGFATLPQTHHPVFYPPTVSGEH